MALVGIFDKHRPGKKARMPGCARHAGQSRHCSPNLASFFFFLEYSFVVSIIFNGESCDKFQGSRGISLLVYLKGEGERAKYRHHILSRVNKRK